jgi:predicted glutamine amidotransferase
MLGMQGGSVTARLGDHSVCRFYALRATAPTRVECCLVQAPNSLLAQSRQDLRGFENADGWGIAAHTGAPQGSAPDAGSAHAVTDWVIERRPHPAHDDQWFQAAAARTQATTVLAHVRHATVGTVALENTHPFAHAGWTFVHNGTVPYFADIRPRLLAAMTADHRAAIRGATDSEHLFHLILSTHEASPGRSLLASLQLALEQVIGWCRAIGQEPHLGLNVLLTDGLRMVGSRWQRTLHYLERIGPSPCPVCGRSHAAGAREDYRALLIASEPITAEPWPEVRERSAFEVTPEGHLHALPLAAA